ncbi:MAG: hypothetical protein MZW92_27190 [Comamonadaceae bacterium]|nr:hypothetical protein [Comamonadaceae bacterium]
MMNLTVLEELLDWSRERPAWQRDALRRLVLAGELSDDDLVLADIRKARTAFLSNQEVVPLKEHVPRTSVGGAPVSLVSILPPPRG